MDMKNLAMLNYQCDEYQKNSWYHRKYIHFLFRLDKLGKNSGKVSKYWFPNHNNFLNFNIFIKFFLTKYYKFKYYPKVGQVQNPSTGVVENGALHQTPF